MIFAETNIIYKISPGTLLRVNICIDRPYLSQSGEYRTRIHFKGLWDKPQEVCGVDSFQSLMLAVKNIKDFLFSLINNSGELYFSEKNNSKLVPLDLSIWGWKIMI